MNRKQSLQVKDPNLLICEYESLGSFPVRPVNMNNAISFSRGRLIVFISVVPFFDILRAQPAQACYTICLVFPLHLCTKTLGNMILKSKSDSKSAFHTRPGSCRLWISCGLSRKGGFTRITGQQQSGSVEEHLLCKSGRRPGRGADFPWVLCHHDSQSHDGA